MACMDIIPVLKWNELAILKTSVNDLIGDQSEFEYFNHSYSGKYIFERLQNGPSHTDTERESGPHSRINTWKQKE